MLDRVWRKGNPPTLLVGMQIEAAIMENSMEVTQKTKKPELPHDPAISLLGIYPDKIIIQKDMFTPPSLPNAQSSTMHNSQDMETT